MNKYLSTICLLLGLLAQHSYGQTISVVNPSFEGPPGVGLTPSPWNVCNGTPDTQPGQFGVTNPPSHGATYIGLVSGGTGLSSNESTSQILSSPILAGNEYILKLDLCYSLGYEGWTVPAKLRIYGTNTACGIDELLWESADPTSSWVTNTATLRPTANYTRITLINAAPLGLTNVMIDNMKPISLTKPQAKFVVTKVCEGNATAFTDSTFAGAAAITTWKWSFGDAASSTSASQHPTFTYPAAGTYNVKLVVTDANGKKDSITNGVRVYPNPTAANEQVIDAHCSKNDGLIRVTGVTGGTSPYQYSLNGGSLSSVDTFPALPPGSNTLLVKDANGCQFSKTIEVANKPGPNSLTTTTTSSSCGKNNGGISITNTGGGTSPYQYSLDGGTYGSLSIFSNLGSGTHTLSAKDANGCIYDTTITLSNVAGPTGFASTITASKCTEPNGSILIGPVTGGTSPYQYSLNGGSFDPSGNFSSLDATSYLIKIKDSNGCEYSKSVTVTDVPGPKTMSFTTTKASCGSATGSIKVSSVAGGTTPYEYSIDSDPLGSSNTFPNLASNGYSIHVRDANGCLLDSIESVADQGGPSGASISTVTALCGQTNGKVLINSVVGGVSPFKYSINGGTLQDSGKFHNLGPGPYSVNIKDATGCLYSTTVNVGNKPGQTGAVKHITDETCTASNGMYSVSNVVGGTSPFTYSLDGGAFGSSPAFNQLSSGAHSITVKDASGCLLKLDTNLNDHPSPTSTQVVTSAELCGTANGSIVVTGTSGGTSPIEYSINGTNFFQSGVFQQLIAGTYTLTSRDANGCSITQSVVVSGSPSPSDLDFSQISSTCDLTNGSITVINTTGGQSPYTYGIDGQSLSATTTFSGIGKGKHTIKVSDANGCTYDEEYILTNIDGPTAIQLSHADPSCGYSNGSITISGSTGGTGTILYSVGSSGFSSQLYYSSLEPGSYPVIAKDDNGCTFPTTVDLIDQKSPYSMTCLSTGSLCGDPNGAIEVSDVSGGTAPLEYAIDTTNYTSNKLFPGLAQGNYDVYVRDANGCTYFTTTAVLNTAGPSDFTFSKINSKCTQPNGRITVTAVTGGKTPYYYSKDGTAGSYSTTQWFQNLAAGSYLVHVKDDNGCIITKTIDLIDIPGPTDFKLDETPSTCGNSNAKLEASAPVGGTGPFKYNLNNGPLTASGLYVSLSSGTEYTVTVQDNNQCKFSKKATPANIPGPTDLSASTISSTCSEANAKIDDISVTGGTSPYEYSIDGANYSSSDKFSGLTAGSLQVSIKDANGCNYSKYITLTDHPAPTAFNYSSTPENCLRKDGSITIDQVISGSSPFTFSLNGKNFDTPSIQGDLKTGSYDLEIKDVNGCIYVDKVIVPYSGFPKAEFEMNYEEGETPLIVNFSDRSTDAATYHWYFGTGDSASTTDTYYTYTDSGVYHVKLVVENLAGCPSEFEHIVRVRAGTDVFAPNTFTPNNDNVNDEFKVVCNGATDKFELSIYNRWGERVFLSTDPNNGWDGLFRNEKCRQDIYTWKLKYSFKSSADAREVFGKINLER